MFLFFFVFKCSNVPMIEMIYSSIHFKWMNLQNQQGIKKLLLPLYLLNIKTFVGTEACLPLGNITFSFNSTWIVWELNISIAISVLLVKFVPILGAYKI